MKKIKKIFITLCSLLMLFGAFNLNLKAKDDTLYYLSFSSPQADKYVSETIGEFINLESSYLGYNLENVSVGSGIYIASDEDNGLLPSFYYPVYVGGNIKYVYRIYDDGSGNYQGIFSQKYAEEIKENASSTPKEAGLWIADNGNEFLLNENNYKTIATSPLAKEPKNYKSKGYQTIDNLDLKATNISENIEYKQFPQKRAYCDRQISYVETQGNVPWCAAYVTAMAVREISGPRTVRAKTIMDYFHKGQSDSCSPDMIKKYCATKGINFTMYNGVTNNTKLFNVLIKWNLVYGGYKSNIGNHALLVHGVDGNSKAHVWNPWYNHSEWTSTVKTYKTNGITFTMYRYGHFIKK